MIWLYNNSTLVDIIQEFFSLFDMLAKQCIVDVSKATNEQFCLENEYILFLRLCLVKHLSVSSYEK